MKKAKKALRMPQLWGIIGCVLVLQVGVMVGGLALTRAVGSHPNDALTAVIVAVVGTMSVCVLVGLAIVFSGGMSWLVGGQAEQWTGDALQRLGPDWRFAHNVEFTIGEAPYSYTMDVDHVGVGPSGVLVIETKYSSEQVDLEAEKLASKIRRAADCPWPVFSPRFWPPEVPTPRGEFSVSASLGFPPLARLFHAE